MARVVLKDVLETDTHQVLHASIAEDWIHLLVLYAGAVRIISLDCYFEAHPDNIFVAQTLQRVRSARGTHGEDSVWRATLVRLKTATDFKRTRVCEDCHWFEKAGLNRGVVTEVKSKCRSERREGAKGRRVLVRHVSLEVWSDRMTLKDVCPGSELAYVTLQDKSGDVPDILVAIQVKSGHTAIHRWVQCSTFFIVVPLLFGVDAWRYTPPCILVVHFLPRQSLLSDITPHSVQPSSLRPSLFFLPCTSIPIASFLHDAPIFASHVMSIPL